MNSRLRILFVIDSLGIGGAERQLVELIKGLVKKGGYEIHLVSLLRQDVEYTDILTSFGIEVVYYPRRYKYDLIGPLFALVRYIREHRIDLVHTFMNMGSLFGALAAKITRRPVVCSAIRDAKDTSRREKYLKRFLSKIADIYVANSRAGFTNRFRKMEPHFRIVYNGVDLSRFGVKNNINRLKSEFGISGFSSIIGMVGSLSDYKDHETFLKAAPKILKAFSKSGFLLVGDGLNRRALEVLAKLLGIEKHIVFAGYRKDVDSIYPLMDVCVLLTNPSILEGIPNVLIEAMASGVPVVASDGGGTSEVIEHSKTGFLVPTQDIESTAQSIIDLLGNPVMATKVAEEAKLFVQKRFCLERYVVDYEIIYKELLYNKPQKVKSTTTTRGGGL